MTSYESKTPAAPADPNTRPLPRIPYPIMLEGQPALVTGANSGIGEAVAIGLAAAGADVVINYITDAPKADAIAHQIEGMGRRALTIKTDVANEDDVTAMFSAATGHFGTLHIEVSNAGVQRDAPFDQMSLEQWNTVIGANRPGNFFVPGRQPANSRGAAWSKPSRSPPARSSV